MNVKFKMMFLLILFFVFIFFSMLFLKKVYFFSRFINRLAIVSTKINTVKDADIIGCFKSFNQINGNVKDYRDFNLQKKKNRKKNEAERNINDFKEDFADDAASCEILRKQYEASNDKHFVNIGGTSYVRNMTNLPNDVIARCNSKKPNFVLEETNEPQVLIYHTHTTESYEPTETNTYDRQRPTRSKDSKINVVGVGDEITKQLKARGIGVIHDTKIYDDPAYSGAYDRTNIMIKNTMKKHPKIKVLLDIHRDSITTEQKKRIAPVTVINNQKVAQVMIISGCDNGANHFKTYEKNLSFACFLQKQIESDFKHLTRPTSFKYKNYNQSLSEGALLVEVGSQANSAQEAQLAGRYFGTSLANALLKIKVKAAISKGQQKLKISKQAGINKPTKKVDTKKKGAKKMKPKESKS